MEINELNDMKKEDFDAFAADELPEGDAPKLGLTPEGMARESTEYAEAFDAPEKPAPAAAKDEFDAAVAEADDMTAERDMDAMDATNAAAPKKPAEPAKAMSFKEAFAAARKDGAKVFDWNGKKYTTQLKSEMPAKKAVQAAVSADAVAVDASVPPRATFAKAAPSRQGSGPALTMLPKEGAPSIYGKRPQPKGSGLEERIPV